MACFGDFAVARLGILAGQTALNITGQNISNINTQGYTRQRLDQYSFVTNNAGFYRSGNSVSAGSGVMLAGVSQLRDPFLDIRFRKEMASVGSAGGLLDGYDSLASIIDDVNKEGITNSLAGLFDAIADLNADHTGEQEFDTLVRKAAEELCTLLNTTAEKLQQELEGKIKEYNENIKDANNILTKIQELNDQIRTADINGDPALELRDQRNLLIDELSEYMKIDVTYSQEDVGSGYTVEKLTIKMVNNETGKPGATLIDGSSRAKITADADQFLNTSELLDLKGNRVSNTNSYFLLSGLEFGQNPQSPQQITIKLADGTQVPVSFPVEAPASDDPDDVADARTKTLANLRDALNGAIGGDFEVSSSKNGITIKSTGFGEHAEAIESIDFGDPATGVSFTHQKDIPAVASNADRIEEGEGYGYLESMRQIITGEGSFRMDGGDTSIRGIPYYQKSLDALANKLATEMNRINTTQPDGTPFDPTVVDGAGNLFVAEGDAGDNPTTTITAANISISQEWQRNEVHIVTTTDPDLSSGNDNLTRFEYLRGQELGFSAIEIARKNGTEYHSSNLKQPPTLPVGTPLQATITYLDDMNQKHTVTIDFTSGADADATMQALEAEINGNQELKDAGLTVRRNNGSSLVIAETDDGNNDNLCSLVTDISITGDKGAPIEGLELGKGSYVIDDVDITGAGSNIYKGALNSFYANMQAVLGSDTNTISTIYDTYATSADSINTSRDSVSGVDLNEEGINLLQYQKSFAAACRLMTTLDEMMDKVINGMGVVGR